MKSIQILPDISTAANSPVTTEVTFFFFGGGGGGGGGGGESRIERWILIFLWFDT